MTPKEAYEILIKNLPMDNDVKQALLDVVKTDPSYAFNYTANVIKGRWTDAEECIKKDPQYAFYYAQRIIEGRWKEAEEFIKKDPWWACQYALRIINGRWTEAEEIIRADDKAAYEYARHLIGNIDFWKDMLLKESLENFAKELKNKKEAELNKEVNTELENLKKQRDELDARIKELGLVG